MTSDGDEFAIEVFRYEETYSTEGSYCAEELCKAIEEAAEWVETEGLEMADWFERR